MASLTRLPEPEELYALEAAAAQAYCAPVQARTVAAPGSQAIINWLPRFLPARHVGILGFTYSEHARAWASAGAKVSTAEELAALEDKDVAVIVNPNNPDGRLVSPQDLLDLARALAKHGGILIVDEAFVDFLAPGASLIPNLSSRGVIVLRSFGKAYGLPGLRLGFAIASTPIADKLRMALGPWPVFGPAIAIGTKALRDAGWCRAMALKLQADAAALDEILRVADFDLLGGSLLFRLVRHERAQAVFERLANAGILVRRFAARPEWLRFGIIAAEADRGRLRQALGIR